MRGEVASLLQELQDACRRSLYNGNFVCQRENHPTTLANNNNNNNEYYYNETSEAGSHASSSMFRLPKRRRRGGGELGRPRNWERILGDAATVLPFMTEQEHGQATRMASILLLGFLLPHSTGNEFFLLQNLSSKSHRSSNHNNNDRGHQHHQSTGSQTCETTPNNPINENTVGDYVIFQMSLTERMECANQRYHPDDFGELDNLVHDPTDACFISFLKNALEPFLSGRPAHTQEVDLLHILAMAIHPHPSEQPIRQTAAVLTKQESDVWSATQLLMSSLVPHSFHINYRHRFQLVQLVADCLVLPEYTKDANNNAANQAPLFEGALPHLRASLYAFGMAAMNPYDAHWGHCGLVSVAIQTGMQYVVREEWGRLLHRLMDDRTNYKCCAHHHKTAGARSTKPCGLSLMTQYRNSFCPHRARGQLLERFLTKFSESRHYADAVFLQHALASLTDAIECQVDCWTKEENEGEQKGEEKGKKEEDDNVMDTDGTKEKDNKESNETEGESDGDEQKTSSTNESDAKEDEERADSNNESETEGDSKENDQKASSTTESDMKDDEKQDLEGAESNKSDEDKCDERMETENKDTDEMHVDNDKQETDGDAEKGPVAAKPDEKQESKVENIEGQSSTNPPCLLASLVYAANPLFYFLLPILNVDNASGEESEESHRRDMLVSCCIQLVHHWDSAIAHEASKLVVLAFCYGPNEMMSDYAGAVFESTKLSIKEALKANCHHSRSVSKRQLMVPIDGMVATFSQKSVSFADSLLALLLSKDLMQDWELDENSGHSIVAIYRLVAAIATASPVAAKKHLNQMIEQVEGNKTTSEARIHLLAALLACRRARFFNQQDDTVRKYVLNAVSSHKHADWDLYLLARHALVTGNFGLAKELYQQLVALSTSETSYLWLSSLERIAGAEEALTANAAKGMPFATMRIRSAVNSLQSLSYFTESASVDFTFQTSFLNLRLDFLDLVAGVRQLTREMRLTGFGPKKNTRPSLHLRNGVKFLNVLAAKYLTLYRQHGLFTCQQSRTSIRTLHALCRFVASAASSVFIDDLPETSMDDFQKNAIQAMTLPKGDACHPLTILMKQLDSTVLKDMDASVDAKIRAAAMLEIIDGVLKVPSPFPRDFTVTKPVPRAFLRISGDPDSVELMDEHGDDDECDDELEISQGASVSFFASGSVPESLLARSKIPFCMILLWHTVSFRRVPNEEDNAPDEKQDVENTSSSDIKSMANSLNLPVISNPAPAATALASNGSFFMKIECEPMVEEGHYSIDTRLGCRDIRGGEWELPLKEATHSLAVRVTRSRS